MRWKPRGVHFWHRDRADQSQSDGDAPMAVDKGLEQAIDALEAAVDAYLDAASPNRRDALSAALGHLDELTALGDDITDLSASTRWGYGLSASSSVLGARSMAPLAENVPGRVLHAQIALVRRAKAALAHEGPAASNALREAAEELAGARDPSADGAPGVDPAPAPPPHPLPRPPPPSVPPPPPPPTVPPPPGLDGST